MGTRGRRPASPRSFPQRRARREDLHGQVLNEEVRGVGRVRHEESGQRSERAVFFLSCVAGSSRGVRRGPGRTPRQTGISHSQARSARNCRPAEGPASGLLAPAPWRAGRREAGVEGSREPEVKADSLLRCCCRRHTRSPCSALPPETVFARPLPACFPPFCKSRS